MSQYPRTNDTGAGIYLSDTDLMPGHLYRDLRTRDVVSFNLPVQCI